jgi:hypothetical protein
MITRIPALEFMQKLVGAYRSADGSTSLLITSVGYGQAMEFRSDAKVHIAGVVGASGPAIELFAQLGLPNVVRLDGKLQGENAISFQAHEPPIGLLLAHKGDSLTLAISINGATGPHHVLQRA